MIVYLVTLRYGENLINDRRSYAYNTREIVGIYADEDKAIRRRDYEEKKSVDNEFGNCQKFYVEPWNVEE